MAIWCSPVLTRYPPPSIHPHADTGGSGPHPFIFLLSILYCCYWPQPRRIYLEDGCPSPFSVSFHCMPTSPSDCTPCFSHLHHGPRPLTLTWQHFFFIFQKKRFRVPPGLPGYTYIRVTMSQHRPFGGLSCTRHEFLKDSEKDHYEFRKIRVMRCVFLKLDRETIPFLKTDMLHRDTPSKAPPSTRPPSTLSN